MKIVTADLPHLPVRSTCGGTSKGQRLQSSTHPVSRPLCSWRWPVVCCPWHHRSYLAGGKWSCWSEIYKRRKRRQGEEKAHNSLVHDHITPNFKLVQHDLVKLCNCNNSGQFCDLKFAPAICYTHAWNIKMFIQDEKMVKNIFYSI